MYPSYSLKSTVMTFRSPDPLVCNRFDCVGKCYHVCPGLLHVNFMINKNKRKTVTIVNTDFKLSLKESINRLYSIESC